MALCSERQIRAADADQARLAFLLSLSLLATNLTLARAQASAYAEIAAIDPSAFPRISALVDVFAANGEFVAGLKPSDITVLEDGEQRPVDKPTQASVPAQIVVAVNPGPALGVRDGSGVARFSRVVEALGNWANSQPAGSQDDLSLVSLSGSLISHGSAQDWFISLDPFKPDFRTTTPNLQSLAIALDTVNAPSLEPDMKRATLFITPHMDDPDIDNKMRRSSSRPSTQRPASSSGSSTPRTSSARPAPTPSACWPSRPTAASLPIRARRNFPTPTNIMPR